MKKRTIIILLILASVAGTLIGTMATLTAYGRKDHTVSVVAGSGDEKMNAIWSLINHNYVDNIDSDTVMDRIYESILSTLDPHSNYLTAKQIRKESEQMRGNFEGVGIVLRMIHDTVCVSQLMSGGPSEKSGIMAGDRIMKVDGIPVTGVKMPSDSVVALLRGPRRSVADIEVYRYSDQRIHSYRVKRGIIATPSLEYSGMLDKTTGYIRLSRFGETTHDEFCDATRSLKSQGMKRMVLDLRGNGGGLLSAAIDICDELLPGRELIVYTEGAHQQRKDARSTPGGLFAEGDLIVMTDEYSASASEIVSGAVQDNDRGIIVGRRTFGKGLVQQQYPLPDGSAVLLTIARYYTPSGRCIQRPYDRGTDQYYTEFLNHVMEEYIDADTVLSAITDSTPYHTAKGRTVYGGGGILPDHIIHIKSDPDIVYYNQLINKGVISDYVLKTVSYHGANIKKLFPTEDDYLRGYAVSDDMLKALFAMGDAKGLTRNQKGIDRYKDEMRPRDKAEIGDMLYGNSTFYNLLLPYDPELKEALKQF